MGKVPFSGRTSFTWKRVAGKYQRQAIDIELPGNDAGNWQAATGQDCSTRIRCRRVYLLCVLFLWSLVAVQWFF